MAQWQRLKAVCKESLPFQQRLSELYNRVGFPIKLRSMFSHWIEAQDWPSHAVPRECHSLLRDLIAQIESKEAELRHDESDTLLDLQQSKHTIQTLVQQRCEILAELLKRCLDEERLLLESISSDSTELRRKNPPPTHPPTALQGNILETRKKLNDLHQQMTLADEKLESVAKQQQDMLNYCSQKNDLLIRMEARRNDPTMNSEDLARQKLAIHTETEKLMQENTKRRNEMAEAHISLAIRLAHLLHEVWSNIKTWQHEQKRSIARLCIPTPDVLDVLNTLCEEGGKLLHRMILQVERATSIFQRLPNQHSSPEEKLNRLDMVLKELKDDYLPKHLLCAFVVTENIPDRVLLVENKGAIFPRITVRILGGRALGLGFSRPKVSMSLVSEHDLKQSHSEQRPYSVIAGTMSECSFATDTSGCCKAEFHSIHVEKLQPLNGKNAAIQKYAFVFRTAVNICGCQIPLEIMSLPIILTTDASQEVTAKGLLVWDAAFSEPNRKMFAYKERAQWLDLARVLDTLFLNNTGRGLTQEHLDYLVRLLPGSYAGSDVGSRVVTERQVVLDKLRGRSFSFWKWLWANLCVVKNLVNNEWREGLIHGFISKEDARSKLQNAPLGTFLLRFSETNIVDIDENDPSINGHGYLTLAVNEWDPYNNVKKPYYVRDYLSPKHIKEHGLGEILEAMEVADHNNDSRKKQLLSYLWPHTSQNFSFTFEPFKRDKPGVQNEDENQDDKYLGSKFIIEIFLHESREAVCHSSPLRRPDSAGSVEQNVEQMVEDVSDAMPLPQFALRQELDSRRPTAKVQPMKAAPGSHVRPVLPTSNTYPDADAASTDMTSDEESSVQSSDSSGAADVDPAATSFVSQLPNGGSFDGAFAAFNIGQH